MKKSSAVKENLFLSVEQTRKKEAYVRAYLRRHPDESGIIFCATRRIAETLCKKLSGEGFPVLSCVEGMPELRRMRALEAFTSGPGRIMIAAGAFRMEKEKTDIRFVIHYNLPPSPEDYCREAGYAGLDSERAECILLFSRQDIAARRMQLKNLKNNGEYTEKEWESLRREDEERLQEMIAYCTREDCLRGFLQRYFGEKPEENCGNCSFCCGAVMQDGWEKEGLLSEGERGKSGPKVRPADTLEEEERILFEQLRILRREIASEKKVPPYIVFSDRTLADMCRKFPRTEAELLEVNGVGEYKLEQYGEQFLKVLHGSDAAQP